MVATKYSCENPSKKSLNKKVKLALKLYVRMEQNNVN